MKRIILLSGMFYILLVAGCQKKQTETETTTPQTTQPEAVSLLGDPLYPRSFSEEALSRLNSNLEKAYNDYISDSSDEMNIIWYGRRLAYMDRYKEAINIYSKGIKVIPDSYKLYRHRGHRYISIRQLDQAIYDLTKAAELAEGNEISIEPDGIPNRLNQPLTTTQWNIYYHLGLAYYLKGDFDNAAKAYLKCYEMSENDDVLVAVTDWMFMTLNRMGQPENADTLLTAISTDMEMIENDSYFNRIMMYKEIIQPDSILTIDGNPEDAALSLATQGYGVGNWYLYHGDTSRAISIFQQVVEGEYWPAFGYIAAEADLARLQN